MNRARYGMIFRNVVYFILSYLLLYYLWPAVIRIIVSRGGIHQHSRANNTHDLSWIPLDRRSEDDPRDPRSIVSFAKCNLSITTTLHTSFTVNNQSFAPVLDDLYTISFLILCRSVPKTKLQLSFDAHEKEKGNMNRV